MPSRRHAAAYVSWVPYFGRSQSFIDSLGTSGHYIHPFPERKLYLLPFKYPTLFVATLWRLFRERPEVVLVMDPPAFATSAVHLYCRITGARYVMDCHSGVFEKPRWRWLLPLQAWYGRRAKAVMVTNAVHEQVVRSWGATPLVVGDPPLHIPGSSSGDSAAGAGEDFVFVVNTFGRDEAVPQLVEAMRRLPHVTFYVSGKLEWAKPEHLEDTPPNVTFTGFLSIEDFWSYARRAQVLVVLTEQENTILRGGWEAMYLGQPLVTSATDALQSYFTSGAVFAENTGEGIARSITDALGRVDELREGMRSFRAEKYALWEDDRRRLEELLDFRFEAPHYVIDAL